MRLPGISAFSTLLGASLAWSAAAITQISDPANTQPVPWQVRLGLHSMQVSQAIPLVDRVVLVPDAATFLDEVSAWRPDGRWPVLFDEDAYAPLFIRAFAPRQIIVRPPVGRAMLRPQQAQLEAAVVAAWGGQPGTDSIQLAFARHRFKPVGVVITSTSDPAWTAAVALAAGRGQPILFVEDRFGRADASLNADQSRALRAAIDHAVNGAGFHIGELGEGIDLITLCREVAGRVDVSLPAELRLNLPNASGDGPVAVTDYLGRRAGGEHYAYTGWIFGSESRSAYIAMCSLFLSPIDVALINAYDTAGQWNAFSTTPAAAALEGKGFITREYRGEAASPAAWTRLIERGFVADFIVMNSSGGKDFFNLVGGRSPAADVPVLQEPAVLHLVHSWSMAAPDSTATVGGRWLDHGVYAYVGSCHEPYLGAFVPPEALVARLMSGVPYLIAARQWAGPFSVPWKINTFGDPLFVIMPPDALPSRRIEQPVHIGDDHRAKLPDWMREAATDTSGSAAGHAMRILSMVGSDDVAIRFWQSLAKNQASQRAASVHALPVLMRKGDTAEFWNAWHMLPYRSERLESMLWHCMTPRLGSLNEDQLLQMQSAVRASVAAEDLERLAPHLTAKFGRAHTLAVIERAAERIENRAVKRRLDELANKIR